MKNIYLLPTENYSPLVNSTSRYGGLFLSKYYSPMKVMGDSYQNIYIISDEFIEERDFGLNLSTKNNIVQYDGIKGLNSYYKKIILTTDPKLISDGVQAIDDEFLQWFVNNSSCEQVKIKEEDYSQKCRECGEIVKRGYSCNRGCFMKSGNFIPTDRNIKYKIIIPQEEPNIYDEYLKEELKKYEGIECIVLNKPEEPKQECPHPERGKEYYREGCFKCWKCGKVVVDSNDELKQETLKEVANKLYPINNTGSMFMANREEVNNSYRQEGFIEGTRWQAEQFFKDDAIQTLEKGITILFKRQERMYSEEEIKNLFNRYNEFIAHHDIEEWQDWIDKQFKKK